MIVIVSTDCVPSRLDHSSVFSTLPHSRGFSSMILGVWMAPSALTMQQLTLKESEVNIQNKINVSKKYDFGKATLVVAIPDPWIDV